MLAEWIDPEGLTPSAVRSAKQVPGMRAFDPLRSDQRAERRGKR
jgi:hypothetical protein